MRIIRLLGSASLRLIAELGRMGIFLFRSVALIFSPPFKSRQLFRQISFFGNKSLVVILLTGAFTGMVLAIQIFYTLTKFGSEGLLGPAVALSLVRELGPVLSALMVTGRAGSALAAEIGIMRITEQIDAITSMALDPFRYLVLPNVLAAVVVFPLLTSIFDIVGIYGGYVVGVKLLGVPQGTYFFQMKEVMNMEDIRIGLYKSLSFGVIVSWICCYKGFFAGYGAEGVSRATTSAVVTSSVIILIWDYFLNSVLI